MLPFGAIISNMDHCMQAGFRKFRAHDGERLLERLTMTD
jgi:hypothetical protein